MKRALLAALVVAVIGAGARAGWLALRQRATAAPVPTLVVTREHFVRTVDAEGNLRAVTATPLSVPPGQDGPKKLAWLADDGSRVKAGDVVIRFDPSDPERQLRDGQADLAAAQARLAKERATSRAAVAGRDAAAALAEEELARTRQFQQKDQSIFSKHQIIESEIDEQLAAAKQAHASEVKQVERALSKSKAGVITVEQQQAELLIHHAQASLARMEVKAPHDGLFVLRRGWRGAVPKVGDQMWPSQTVAEIPLLDTMEAEVFVLEVDANGLAEGQSVDVTIEAHPEQPFHGKVRMVEKLAKPRVPGSPVQYFAVVVALDETDRERMKPGQRVRAVITLADEEALVVPRQAVVVDRTGKNVVYRRRAGQPGFDPVPVELGAATAGRVVITSGLSAGDRIALRDPTRSVAQALGGGGGSGSAASSGGEAAP